MKKKIMSVAIAIIALATFGATAQTYVAEKAKDAPVKVIEHSENVVDKTGNEMTKENRNVKNRTKADMQKMRKDSNQLQRVASKEMRRTDRKFNGTERKVCKEACAAKCATLTECFCDSLNGKRSNDVRIRHNKRVTKEFRRHHQTPETQQSTTVTQDSPTQK